MGLFLTIGAIGAVLLGLKPILNNVYEMCSQKWIPADIHSIKMDLEKNVFGQPVVQERVYPLLQQHITSESSKALAFYFYGPPGTGKNLVTSLIAKNLYKKGSQSRYYHYFNGIKDFSHPEKKAHYQETLKIYVIEATISCERNLFVFDEVDKIVPGVLDALLSFIDASRPMYGLDFHKNIFIFLSNSGGKELTSLTMKYLEDGKNREDMTFADTSSLIQGGKLFQDDGLKDSPLRNLVWTVPFLPLEKEHVVNCIKAELKAKKWLASKDVLNSIANELRYIPPEKEMFSDSGCRKVQIKMQLYVNDFFR